MSIKDILVMGDVDAEPVMEVGSIVVPIDPRTPMLPIPTMYAELTPERYGFAIVISMSPFTLASESGNMRWQSTVKAEDFMAVGKANQSVVAAAMARLNG